MFQGVPPLMVELLWVLKTHPNSPLGLAIRFNWTRGEGKEVPGHQQLTRFVGYKIHDCIQVYTAHGTDTMNCIIFALLLTIRCDVMSFFMYTARQEFTILRKQSETKFPFKK